MDVWCSMPFLFTFDLLDTLDFYFCRKQGIVFWVAFLLTVALQDQGG